MKNAQTQRAAKTMKLRALCIVPCFFIASTVIALLQVARPKEGSGTARYESRHLLEDAAGSLYQCIPSGISSFPQDFFTQDERMRGGVVAHLLITAYVCAMIAVVCDDFFIPSLDIISDKLNLPSDIAGATFMAIGTSAPELFSSITGSFITQGDIGVGTIIGSAVFNILAVTGLVGLILWEEELDIDWYPIARDCTAYGLTIACLIWIISDNIVTWWESLILLTIFLFYILLICFNSTVEKWLRTLASSISCRSNCCEAEGEVQPLLSRQIIVSELLARTKRQERDSFSVEITASKEQAVLQANNDMAQIALGLALSEDGTNPEGSLCTTPSGGAWRYVWWILMYPASVLFFLTIPDCRSKRCLRWYPLTFLMSVVWIGVLSYLAVWMVTVIGFTFSIPDSVSGVTLLAAGTSVPEIISSVIVAKSGLGNMAVSNLVGSNTFDISFCLGAPWLVKTLLSDGYLIVYSSALTYTTATLLLTLVLFVLVFQLSSWKLNRKVGLVCLLIYAVFAVLACLYELNVFGEINLPTCDVA